MGERNGLKTPRETKIKEASNQCTLYPIHSRGQCFEPSYFPRIFMALSHHLQPLMGYEFYSNSIRSPPQCGYLNIRTKAAPTRQAARDDNYIAIFGDGFWCQPRSK